MYRCLGPKDIGINESFETCLELAAAAGFQGIDINIGELAELAPAKHWRALMERHGLVPGVFGAGVTYEIPDEAVPEALERTRQICRYGRELGTNRARTGMVSWSDERPFEQEFEFRVSRFKPFAQVLADEGCRCGIEFHGPKHMREGHKYEFVHDVKGTLELCKAIGTGTMGLLLDAFHWYTSYGTLEELRTLSETDVICVHLNDAPAGRPVDEQHDLVRCLPGETGVIDLVGFLQALDEIGYTGPVTPEPFRQDLREMPSEEASQITGEAMKSIWAKAGLSH